MTQEDADLGRLLQLARQADLPDAARLARVRTRALPPTAAVTSVAQPAAVKGLLGAKIIVGLAALGLGVWAYADLANPAQKPLIERAAPPPMAAEMSAPQVPAPSDEPRSAPARVEAPQPKPQQQPQPKRARPKPAPVAQSTLAQETALLQLAMLELRAGRLERARASLAQFARTYPDSALNADRERLEQRIAGLTVTSPARALTSPRR